MKIIQIVLSGLLILWAGRMLIKGRQNGTYICLFNDNLLFVGWFGFYLYVNANIGIWSWILLYAASFYLLMYLFYGNKLTSRYKKISLMIVLFGIVWLSISLVTS